MFRIRPNHQFESSWAGKGNGCLCVLFSRESVFCQLLRWKWAGCSTGLHSCCLLVPFSTAEGTGEGLLRVSCIDWLLALILLYLTGSRTGWSPICWSLQLMSECVCVCVFVHMYAHMHVCVYIWGWLALFPAVNICCCCLPTSIPPSPVKSPWFPLGESPSPTFSPEVVAWLRSSSSTFLPSVTGSGMVRDFIQATESNTGTFDGTTGEKMCSLLLGLLI